jgi:DNA sulfur modification protein DndD
MSITTRSWRAAASLGCELTRTCHLRRHIGTPTNDDDYVIEFFLVKDGQVLGPQVAAAELKRILPEQISRFFLFDGEFLQEYEDLLNDESDMGPRYP